MSLNIGLRKFKLAMMYIASLAIILGSVSFVAPHFFGQIAYATEYDVCGTGCDYPSIQDAIDSSSVNATITVAPGIYNEYLKISKSITLQGADKTSTFINGDGISGGAVVLITSSNVTVKGFTVRNSGTNINTDAGIGLVGVSTSVTGVTVEDNIIYE
jgi:pectin methylesterase-like acyl-CoA thioesterase